MPRIGILGGGQLGRMFIQNALNYPVKIHVLDPSAQAPCASIAHAFTVGDFRDRATVLDFGRGLTHLTIEIEDVHAGALAELAADGITVVPAPDVISMIQDKGRQKSFYASHAIPTSPFALVDSADQAGDHPDLFPAFVKSRRGGYDGKGVQPAATPADVDLQGPLLIERAVDVQAEISIIGVRSASGELAIYDPIELVFDPALNLVDHLIAPADLGPAQKREAHAVAEAVLDALDAPGIFAIELFVDGAGRVLVNEMAPRTHNSGHHTIEAAVSSQFDQHLRAVLGWPLGDARLVRPAAMINLIGAPGFEGAAVYRGMEDVLRQPGLYLHQYGKAATRPGRKMGHITIVDASRDAVASRVRALRDAVRVEAAD